MGLYAQVRCHSREDDLRGPALAQLERQIVGLWTPDLVGRGNNGRPIENVWLELLEEVGAGPGKAINGEWSRALEHMQLTNEHLARPTEFPERVGWILVMRRNGDGHEIGRAHV